MGVIALVLYRAGLAPGFSVPSWVVFVSAVSLSLGVGLGGWRVIRTLGARMYRLRPVDGFVSQTTATLIVLGATLLGGPVSLNQVATSAILGAGAAQRRSKIRWEAAQMTLYSWAITLPATCLVALALYPLVALIVA
jgi:PiT family inorganic phosphate transporter